MATKTKVEETPIYKEVCSMCYVDDDEYVKMMKGAKCQQVVEINSRQCSAWILANGDRVVIEREIKEDLVSSKGKTIKTVGDIICIDYEKLIRVEKEYHKL